MLPAHEDASGRKKSSLPCPPGDGDPQLGRSKVLAPFAVLKRETVSCDSTNSACIKASRARNGSRRRKDLDMQFETLATGYGLLEGPRTDYQNRLYYSDIRGG